MEYYNYLTTPSGKECNLYEISNRDYLILLKFLNGDNFLGFYNKLNDLIKKSIPDFEEYDICDKAYVYMAYYYYSVKTHIKIKADKFDAVDVPLTIILDSLETEYKKKIIKSDFLKWECEIGYPTKINPKNDSIDIDYISGLKSVGGNILNQEEKDSISKEAPLFLLNKIENIIKKEFGMKVYFAKNIAGISDISDNILNPAIFYSIAFIYKDSLEHYYNMLYLVCHYIRVQWESILNMTPLEMTILYNNFVEDKERQSKKQGSGGRNNININDPNLEDSLMGI